MTRGGVLRREIVPIARYARPCSDTPTAPPLSRRVDPSLARGPTRCGLGAVPLQDRLARIPWSVGVHVCVRHTRVCASCSCVCTVPTCQIERVYSRGGRMRRREIAPTERYATRAQRHTRGAAPAAAPAHSPSP
eukprot:6286248-Prymnesium_polylepis.2